MASFKTMQDFIDDEEFLVLSDLCEWNNPCFPHEDYSLFNLDEMTDPECRSEFRFRKRDILILADVLGIPETLRCEQGSSCDGLEGLCMVLRRLSWDMANISTWEIYLHGTLVPCRYEDMIPRFAKPVPVISMVTNAVLDIIYATHIPRITRWNQDFLDPDQMEMYARQNCFGFIDGTVRPIARPGDNQCILYNGHKRVHALKFQSVVLPNGLIANMYGPVGKLCVPFASCPKPPFKYRISAKTLM